MHEGSEAKIEEQQPLVQRCTHSRRETSKKRCTMHGREARRRRGSRNWQEGGTEACEIVQDRVRHLQALCVERSGS